MKDKKTNVFREIIGVFDRQYLAKVILYTLGAAAGIALVLYVGYHVISNFLPGYELVDAVPKTVTKTVRADAYIMRDEEPLYAYDIASGLKRNRYVSIVKRI